MNAELTSATKRHVAPIVQLDAQALFRGGTADDVQDQATLTFLSWAGRTYGVTNQHVVAAYRARVGATLCIALDRWRPLDATLRYVGGGNCPRFPLDLAIFEWRDGYDLEAVGKAPLALPAQLSTPVPDELVLAVGYPGVRRKQVSATTVEHGLYHIGCFAGVAGDSNLPLRLNQADLDPEIRAGGISGGPVLRVTAENYELAAIIYEGLGPADLAHSAFGRETLMATAIPLSGEQLEQLLASGCR